jgi:hypothetical protein
MGGVEQTIGRNGVRADYSQRETLPRLGARDGPGRFLAG